MKQLGKWMKNHPNEIVIIAMKRTFRPGSLPPNLKMMKNLCEVIERTVGECLFIRDEAGDLMKHNIKYYQENNHRLILMAP